MHETVGNREAVERVVRDHAKWVFAAAKRRVRDAMLAEDVTQAVFLLYWRKGVGIAHQGKLVGWLYRAVRYCSANALRLKRIREQHEREAAMEMHRDGRSAGWSEVEAELEGVVDRLSEQDRRAVVLRFYRSLSLREVGKAMGLSEDAARKRVERAVEKLRERLAASGVTVEAGSLVGLVSAHASGDGAAGLVEKVVGGIGSGVKDGTAGAIAHEAGKMMVLAKVAIAATVVGALLLGAGAVAADRLTSTSTQTAASGNAGVTAGAPADSATVQPLTDWQKPVWNGRSQLAGDDLLLAKQILGRYAANFAKISSVSLHEDVVVDAVIDNQLARDVTKAWRDRYPQALDIVVRRDPLYFHMSGTRGGAAVDFEITPEGVRGNSFVGVARSLPPAYLDGDQRVDMSVLESANRVQQDVVIDKLDQRAAKGLLPGSLPKDARYDIICTESRNPNTTGGVEAMTKSYWFNRETGMLDFVVVGYQADDGTRPLASSEMIQYQIVEGIYYPEHVLARMYDGSIQITKHRSNLAINKGIPPARER